MTDSLDRRFRGESVGRALDLVGERWTLLILREAFFGVRRYGQFVRNLNIPRPTLSARLESLEHCVCGQVGEAYVACRCCGEEITAHNVTARPGGAG